MDFIFCKGFVPKSRFKQQNDFAIFFQPKRMLRFTGYGVTHLLYSVMIMAGYEGQEISSDPSVVQNIPCGREGPEGMHLSMENYCNKNA